MKTIQLTAFEHTTKNGTVYTFIKRKDHYVAFTNGNDTSITVNTTSFLNFLDTLEIDSELIEENAK
jgi:hypothetical protein